MGGGPLVLPRDQSHESSGKQGISDTSAVGGHECVGSDSLAAEEARVEKEPAGKRNSDSVRECDAEVVITDQTQTLDSTSGRASHVLRHEVPFHFESLFAFGNTGNKCYQNATLVALLSAFVRLGSPHL